MAQWIAYTHQNQHGFGKLAGEDIQVHTGNLFQNPQPNGMVLKLSEVEITLPCQPSKLIGLWNNYHAQAAKQNLSTPAEPLYFIKAASSYLAQGQSITTPAHYDGRVVYEGELGIVIGQVCKNADEHASAKRHFWLHLHQRCHRAGLAEQRRIVRAMDTCQKL
jgi:2-keto-4-pentenoate hydratase/2-oxohepta-3-ene-1,7-dioic acid hydratase in catechol pathway